MKLIITSFLLLVSVQANAILFDRGNGLIYDDVLNITWLQDANYAMTSGYDDDGRMSLAESVTWADQLSYGDYDDWRLASVSPISGGYRFNTIDSYNGSTDVGYNITNSASELAYMYYVTLGNVGVFDSNGNYTGCGLISSDPCLTNRGPFDNLMAHSYWSADGNGNYGAGFLFSPFSGYQNYTSGSRQLYAWAVRGGDVKSVPEPTNLALMCLGLAGIGFSRIRKAA